MNKIKLWIYQTIWSCANKVAGWAGNKILQIP
jgi:hypothetical protein